MNDGPVVAVSAKIPVPWRDKLAALARRRNVTPSALIRSLIGAYLAGSVADEIGEVEAAVRAEFEDGEVGRVSVGDGGEFGAADGSGSDQWGGERAPVAVVVDGVETATGSGAELSG